MICICVLWFLHDICNFVTFLKRMHRCVLGSCRHIEKNQKSNFLFVLVVCRNSKILGKTRKHNKTQFWRTSIVVCYDFEEKMKKLKNLIFWCLLRFCIKFKKSRKLRKITEKTQLYLCFVRFWLKIKENTKQNM